MKKLCVIQVAALGHELVQQHAAEFADLGLEFRALTPPFPAVTCTAQATFRTGMDAAEHGMVCNGVYSRESSKTDFWNQSAHLLPEKRIWNGFRERGGTVGTICWQQSLGDAVELILSPAPIHKHHGGMIQGCYSKPAGLYAEICESAGKFNLFRYWGPTAGLGSTRWIADATCCVLDNPKNRPDLLLTYLPHLDYILQKQGPSRSRTLSAAVNALARELRKVVDAARSAEYEILIFGDYAITQADFPVFPNRELREAGLMQVRDIKGMAYPDLFSSRAFAMVDHQVAHVYVRHPQDVDVVRQALVGLSGVDEIRDHESMPHSRSGELILVARKGAWFAYPWWADNREAPEFAAHVDIHNKPGFDPAELFWGKLIPPTISLDADKVKGTHGRTTQPAAYATTAPELTGSDLTDLAQTVGAWLIRE